MGSPKLLSVLIAILMIVSAVVSQNSKHLSADEVKGRQVRKIDLDQVTTINAVTSALNAAHVPGGIATITNCGPESFNLTPAGSTLGDVLDSIVAANPQYKWHVDDGVVVNLVPASNEPTLLDAAIANFEGEYGKTQDDILQKLLSMPEVKEARTRLHLREGFTEIGFRPLARPGFEGPEPTKGFALHLRNTTVRDVLNALARAHGSAVWSYQEKRCGGQKEFSITFLVW